MRERERLGFTRSVVCFPVWQLNDRYLSSGICYPISGDDCVLSMSWWGSRRG